MSCCKRDAEYEDCFPEEQELRKRKTYGRVLGVFVGLSAILSVSAMILYLNRKNEVTSEKIPVYCVSCSNIEDVAKVNEDAMKLFKSLKQVQHETSDDMQCCADTKTQATALVKLLSRRLSNKTAHSHSSSPSLLQGAAKPEAAGVMSSLRGSQAFAQKALCFKKERITSNVPRLSDEMCLLNIEKSTNRRYELISGVDLTDTGIKVLYPGLYFVYKSVNFFPDSGKPCKEFPEQVFKSLLIRARPSRQENILLSNVHTCCPDCVHDSETGFAGGMFELEKGDIIQVNVTSAGYIHLGRDVTYMGLMMVGGKK